MDSQKTYLITGAEIEATFGIADAVKHVEEAFRLCGEGGVQMPPKVYLTFPEGDLRCMPVYVPALGAAGVKNVNVHPKNRDMPSVMATITLLDPDSGFPLAIMDGTYLTGMRTGAAGAVAARYMARQDARVVGFIGTGAQAEAQVEGLMVTVAGLRRVLGWDLDEQKARAFCEQCRRRHGLEAEVPDGPESVVRQADILITITPSREPVVQDKWLPEGTHVNAIGADARGKQELDPAVLHRARIVVDNWEQASHSGEINVAIQKGVLSREDVAGDIGEVVTGRKQGRTSADEITVFDSTGLAIQDIACAHAVYRKLTGSPEREGRLRTISFF